MNSVLDLPSWACIVPSCLSIPSNREDLFSFVVINKWQHEINNKSKGGNVYLDYTCLSSSLETWSTFNNLNANEAEGGSSSSTRKRGAVKRQASFWSSSLFLRRTSSSSFVFLWILNLCGCTRKATSYTHTIHEEERSKTNDNICHRLLSSKRKEVRVFKKRQMTWVVQETHSSSFKDEFDVGWSAQHPKNVGNHDTSKQLFPMSNSLRLI